MKIHVRKIIEIPSSNLWDYLTGDFTLVFDNDEEMLVSSNATIYSRYIWEMFSGYINTPILPEHHLTYNNPENVINNNTHGDLINKCYWQIVDFNNIHDYETQDKLREHFTRVVNYIYNDQLVKLTSHICSIDLMDYIEINTHPKVQSVITNMVATSKSIKDAYEKVGSIIRTDEQLRNNPLGRAMRLGIVKEAQAMQCLVARGYITDIDSSIFAHPVMNGYLDGLETSYDLLVESRSAAKSLYFSLDNLSASEYFARKLQLISMVVERLQPGDCGSTEYTDWNIRPAKQNDSGQKYAGDLKNLLGKFYLDETTGKLKVLTMDDTHLIGKNVKLRSALHCIHPDKHGVCETCVGMLSETLLKDGNLGHQASVNVTKLISQALLSAKHLDGSSSGMAIQLDNISNQYFEIGKDKTCYHLKRSLKKYKDIKITISSDQAYGMADVHQVDDIEDLNPSRVSGLEEVGISFKDGDDEVINNIIVAQKNKKALFTTEFIKFIREYGYKVDSKNNFTISMDNWDMTAPMFRLPNTEYNFSDLASEVTGLLESNTLTIKKGYNNPKIILSQLFDVINNKLNVNLALLEIIVYSYMVKGNGSYDLARNSGVKQMASRNQIMTSRSLAPALGFQNQVQVLYSPLSFYNDGRPDSVFDTLLAPREVIENRKKRGLPY